MTDNDFFKNKLIFKSDNFFLCDKTCKLKSNGEFNIEVQFDTTIDNVKKFKLINNKFNITYGITEEEYNLEEISVYFNPNIIIPGINTTLFLSLKFDNLFINIPIQSSDDPDDYNYLNNFFTSIDSKGTFIIQDNFFPNIHTFYNFQELKNKTKYIFFNNNIYSNIRNYKNLLDNLSKNQNISNQELKLSPFFYSDILKLEGCRKINKNKLNINDTESKDKELDNKTINQQNLKEDNSNSQFKMEQIIINTIYNTLLEMDTS